MADVKQYVNLQGLAVYDGEIKNYIEEQVPDLDELDSVSITSPADNQFLGYDAQNDRWENKSALTGAFVQNETLVIR